MLCRRQVLIPELADLPLPYPLCFKMEMNEAQNHFKYHFTRNSNHHFSLCSTALFTPCFPVEKKRKREGKKSCLVTGRVHECVLWKHSKIAKQPGLMKTQQAVIIYLCPVLTKCCAG